MTTEDTTSSESLLQFPCDFTIKIFGRESDEFESAVKAIIAAHVSSSSEPIISSRLSENRKFRALTITLHVTTKQQLDEIYQALSNSPHVLMAL